MGLAHQSIDSSEVRTYLERLFSSFMQQDEVTAAKSRSPTRNETTLTWFDCVLSTYLFQFRRPIDTELVPGTDLADGEVVCKIRGEHTGRNAKLMQHSRSHTA